MHIFKSFLRFFKDWQDDRQLQSEFMISFKEALQDTNPITGHAESAKQQVQRMVSSLIKNANAFYIGKTSGSDGLENRWNDKYKKGGMRYICPVYQTTSNEYANGIERHLINYFKNNKACKNKVAGGGGNTNGKVKQLVYVAWK